MISVLRSQAQFTTYFIWSSKSIKICNKYFTLMVVKMFLDDVGVTVAMITVTLVAAVIVLLKVFLFQIEVTD